MPETLHIIVSCTNRKRAAVPAELCLRSVPGRAPEVRARAWWERLSAHPGPTLPALELYAGDHWSIARELPDIATSIGLAPRLWVASAGYGLVESSTPLHAYSATFQNSHPDSVVGPAFSEAKAQKWWEALGSFGEDPAKGQAARLAEIEPTAYYLVVASPEYIKAMEVDLLQVLQRLKAPERLLIVSSRTRLAQSPLSENLIPSEAPLQANVGGVRGSLHVRVARKLLQEAPRHELHATKLKDHYEKLLSAAPPPPRFERDVMTDEEVCRFIRQQLKTDRELSHTPLLRLLRSSGRACEQSRFKRLFQEVKGAR